MKIGIIQTRGIGDIIIACPIALYYIRQGHTVYWPIDARDHAGFSAAFPEINFIPVPIDLDSYEYALGFPDQCLQNLGCEKTLLLPSELARTYPDGKIISYTDKKFEKLDLGMKFDEYKYGVAGVPFREKWNFKPRRDLDRETALLKKIRGDSARPFVLCHLTGSRVQCELLLADDIKDNYDIIHVEPLTDNVFDWISAFTAAAAVYTLDGCFANLVEQMDLNENKTFIYWNARTKMTPTLINKWNYM